MKPYKDAGHFADRKITALLPMKGHSERVKNKNLRLFNGRPLYHCVAEVLQASKFIDAIIIDTDSSEIAEDASNNFKKAKIVKRPKEICGDMVSMNRIIANDINFADQEHILQTHSTNPLLRVETLDRAVSKFFDALEEYDSLFSVTRIQTRLYWESGKAINHNPAELLRTQDLPPVFEENSNIYIFSKKGFINSGHNRIGKKPLLFPINKIEAIDIDEEEDFIIAETLYKLRERGLDVIKKQTAE